MARYFGVSYPWRSDAGDCHRRPCAFVGPLGRLSWRPLSLLGVAAMQDFITIALVCLLSAFIVVRAASFHHMDVWVTADVEGMRTGWWLEIAGIFVIAGSALRYSRDAGTLDRPADYAPEANDGAQG